MNTGLTAHLVVERSERFGIDIDLDLACGRTVALLGPNGAGKSTVVGALAGLLPLNDGRVVLDGRVLDDPAADVYVSPEDRGIGIVFQDYLLFPHLTVLDNVAFGLRSRGESRQTSRFQASDWMERFGLEAFAAHKPGQLSGGQAQRVALARALAIEPGLLLLDEPLAALDVTTRAQLRRELADHLAGFAGSRLIITHDPTEAFLLADLIYVIEAGAVTQTGTPDDIRLRPATPYIADLAGSNLIAGSAQSGTMSVGSHQLTVADTNIDGSVLATIHPRAISIHRSRPVGSPRNSWQTQIVRIEHYGDRVRLQTGDPLPLTVELTPGAVDELHLQIDDMVWVSIKATEVGIASR